MEERAPAAYAWLIMSADNDTTRAAAAEAAAAPLDLLLGDAATGMLRRMNPAGSGLRLAAKLAVRPRLVVRRRRPTGRPAPFPRRGGGAAGGPAQGPAGRVRSGGGGGGHARVGGVANPGAGADQVPPAHARGPAGPAGDPPAGDQQVLRDGPG